MTDVVTISLVEIAAVLLSSFFSYASVVMDLALVAVITATMASLVATAVVLSSSFCSYASAAN